MASEAKFIASFEVLNQGIWLRNFIAELRIVNGIERLLKINYDNKSVELYSKNKKNSSKSEHIDIKFVVLKDRV